MRPWFHRLPTAAKLLLLLSLALLPIGLAMIWAAQTSIDSANAALDRRAEEQDQAVARSIEALIARNALALRIAANAALASPGKDDCEEARRSLAIAPAISRSFAIETLDSKEHCSTEGYHEPGSGRVPAASGIAMWLSPADHALYLRVSVANGLATDIIPFDEIAAAAREINPGIRVLHLDDGINVASVIGNSIASGDIHRNELRNIAAGQLSVRVTTPANHLTTSESLALLLPLAMWVAAALIGWLVITRLLIRPLRRMERAVSTYDPRAGPFAMPQRIGPAIEIESLGEAFSRAVARIETSEQEMSAALEGQRRLVREVHHRVKNNLQVVASLLSIHGRNAEASAGRAAYAAIGRRVDALAVVHRNHFAEGEANRGIALRPLLTELAAGLRGSAPEAAQKTAIGLDADNVHTTQDVAVAIAFLLTEVVEFSMLDLPDAPIEIDLRRTGELTARLTLDTAALSSPDATDTSRAQFERIITGLARQLRSSLEMRLGRLSVELPIFPD